MKVEQKVSLEDIQSFKEKKCVLSTQALRRLAAYYAHQSDDLAATLRLHQHQHRQGNRQHKHQHQHLPSPLFLEVSYEEMVANMSRLITERVAPFLGIPATPKAELASRPSSLEKASPELLCQSLENYDETCAAVKGQMSALFRQLFNVDACAKEGGGSTIDTTPHKHATDMCCPRC